MTSTPKAQWGSRERTMFSCVILVGVGYHMVMVKEPGCDVDKVTEAVLKFVPEAELESNVR